MSEIYLDTSSVESYRTFLAVKGLPRYRFAGHVAHVPDEYLSALGLKSPRSRSSRYEPSGLLFDYQRDISALAIRKQKFAIFARCGLGKTLCIFEFARHVRRQAKGKKVLIVSPLNVVPQTIGEGAAFYGPSLALEQLTALTLPAWLCKPGGGTGIVNYEAIKGILSPRHLAAIILDESSLLKSQYGAWGQRLIALGRGVPWKLCLTGTPAPNDRIEYATHAVFLDRFPTVNSFLARYFVNRGQTDNRWELKAHALRPFYRSLSDWCIFLNDPATYGWKDNVGTIPPIHVRIHDVPMTPEQRALVSSISGDLYGSPGGITSRSKLSQLAKGRYTGGIDRNKHPEVLPGLFPDAKVPTNKPAYIRDLIASWPEESTIVWVQFNHEQDTMEAILPGAASLRGSTPDEERIRLIDDFKSGRTRTIISKDKILGFGLNLQIATRHVFNGLKDSYESFHQCLMRSNRVGSTRDLYAHIPLTEIEYPMMQTVLAKKDRVDRDTAEQEIIFKEVMLP